MGGIYTLAWFAHATLNESGALVTKLGKVTVMTNAETRTETLPGCIGASTGHEQRLIALGGGA